MVQQLAGGRARRGARAALTAGCSSRAGSRQAGGRRRQGAAGLGGGAANPRQLPPTLRGCQRGGDLGPLQDWLPHVHAHLAVGQQLRLDQACKAAGRVWRALGACPSAPGPSCRAAAGGDARAPPPPQAGHPGPAAGAAAAHLPACGFCTCGPPPCPRQPRSAPGSGCRCRTFRARCRPSCRCAWSGRCRPRAAAQR